MKSWSDIGISVPVNATGEYYTTCPKCSPSRKKQGTRCLSANIPDGVFFCHHCGWSGSLQKGEWSRAEVKREWTRPTYVPAQTDDEKMMVWFHRRGITSKVVSRNRIKATDVWMPQTGGSVSAIAFPYFRAGECLNVKYRDYDKNFRMEANAEQTLYGLDDMLPNMVVVVEGEMDKLAVEVAGILSCVSVPAGAPNADSKEYSSKFDFLENSLDQLKPIKCFVLATDADPNGRKLEDELGRRLGKHRCKRVMWPDGCKDANDVLLKHSAAALSDCIMSARHFPIDGVFTVDDFCQDIDDLYAKGFQRGDLLGYQGLDELYSVVPGELTVVTGIPNHGKSEFLDQMLVRLAMQHGYKIGMFSPENQPLSYHFFKLAEKYIGKPGFNHGRLSPSELQKSKDWCRNHFRFVLPKPEDRSVDKVLDTAAEVVLRDGIKGMVFDPWNEFEHNRTNGMSEHEYIGWALMRVHEFARSCGVHVWIVAHPTKMQRDLQLKKDTGNDAYLIPKAYDISGSSNWYNKPEVVMSVYRWFDGSLAGMVEVHIQKCRFKGTGKPGMAMFRYDVRTGRYVEVDPSPPDADEKELPY